VARSIAVTKYLTGYGSNQDPAVDPESSAFTIHTPGIALTLKNLQTGQLSRLLLAQNIMNSLQNRS